MDPYGLEQTIFASAMSCVSFQVLQRKRKQTKFFGFWRLPRSKRVLSIKYHLKNFNLCITDIFCFRNQYFQSCKHQNRLRTGRVLLTRTAWPRCRRRRRRSTGSALPEWECMDMWLLGRCFPGGIRIWSGWRLQSSGGTVRQSLRYAFRMLRFSLSRSPGCGTRMFSLKILDVALNFCTALLFTDAEGLKFGF